MAQRIRPSAGAYNARPFDGEGVSVYVSAGTSVVYRRLRCLGGRWVKGTGGSLAAVGVAKTSRLGSQAAVSGDSPSVALALPADLIGTDIVADVRHYKDDVENTTENYRTARLTTDGSGNGTAAILGAARLLSVEQRAGGVLRFRFAYLASPSGLAPETFRLQRTAGPTSPADATDDWDGVSREVVIDTAALSDASPYTFRLVAEAGATTAVLLTGIAATADASGPPAPTLVSAEAV